MRGLAGFLPAQAGHYWLHRSGVDPPDDLVQLVWPWRDVWLRWINDNELEEANMAVQGFLHLLGELRTTFLQDSILLRYHHPYHPIW